jgi:hypothetical protein
MSLLDDLKEIDIVNFLQSNGYTKVKETSSKVWFLSPIHQENNPSFCVYKGENRWRDFGTQLKKGDVIDLVCAIENCDITTAMEKLKEDSGVVKYEPVEISSEPLISVSKVLDRYIDPRLILYMKSRGIPESIYSVYTKEVHYWFKDTPEKSYNGVGFFNDEGGCEIRSQIHKYATAPKAITTTNNDGCVLNLWEGFINYFSTLAYFGVEKFEGTTIVLNGLGMLYRITDTLNQYQKINCFFDWGKGGNEAVGLIRSIVGADKVFDMRCLLPDGMDMNDLWININK